ncbi:erythroblast NAD(P)(+)--arginine ADP-ribosyltransferase-like [Rhincodon typus]|uniref:erythroblast NAD(P)(+)--arginine ADP-ribosyltransferase-like n=1 Tax=Rhincodon typus TaxID=259920 RepID=UPI002030801F|nr:erythroblast NAD(P)(+)--arginine ADP-ribosyltransferase-like [Rhincodon typus]
MHALICIVLLSLNVDCEIAVVLRPGDKYIHLDMANSSAAYIFTQTREADQAAISYIREEWKRMPRILKAWDKANSTLERNCVIPRGLRREHLVAIRAYTHPSALFKAFNAATRQYGVSDDIYEQNFTFKSFHYLLSVALDKLKGKRFQTYRGSENAFWARKGKSVRFGQFASSSLDLMVAKRFMKNVRGENTLFEIKTKLGVNVSQYSTIKDEDEVIIPPTEVFNVKYKPCTQKHGNKKWVKIGLQAVGCQGIVVTVEKTRKGSLRVRRGRGKCPSYCKCSLG